MAVLSCSAHRSDSDEPVLPSTPDPEDLRVPWPIDPLPHSAARSSRSTAATVDERIVRLVMDLARPFHAAVVAVHVVEIDWTLPLDANVAGMREEAQRVLDMAEAAGRACTGCRSRRSSCRPATSGPRSSTRPRSVDADLLVLGLPYRKRFGGDFAIGRTVPYVLKNAPCAVWVAREPMPEETQSMKSRHRRLRPRRAPPWPRALDDRRPRRHHRRPPRPAPSTACRRRSGATRIRGDGTDEDTLRRAGAEDADLFLALTEGDNRNIMAAQVAVRGARDPPGLRQDQRPGPRRRPTPSSGSATICRTTMMADALLEALGQRATADPRSGRARRIRHPRSGRPGMARPRPPAAGAAPIAAAASAGRPEPMFVLVVGGGKVGYYLTKELIESGHEVVLMEKDRGRADQIADEIGSIVVGQGRLRGERARGGRREPGRRRGGGDRRRRGQPRHLPDGQAPLRVPARPSRGSTTRRTSRSSGTSAWTS